MDTNQEYLALKEKIFMLDNERKALEEEIETGMIELGDIGLTGSLVDSEGFPKPNIDHYAIRRLRHRVNCAKTDLREKMKEIEQSLHALHAINARRLTENPNVMDICTEEQKSVSTTTPFDPLPTIRLLNSFAFALVNTVSPSSPAEASGLKVNDRILMFGNIHAFDFDKIFAKLREGGRDLSRVANCPTILPKLETIGEVVGRNENVGIPVYVLRGLPNKLPDDFANFDFLGGIADEQGSSSVASSTASRDRTNIRSPRQDSSSSAAPIALEVHKIMLTPRKWSGPGLLGCHILPILRN